MDTETEVDGQKTFSDFEDFDLSLYDPELYHDSIAAEPPSSHPYEHLLIGMDIPAHLQGTETETRALDETVRALTPLSHWTPSDYTSQAAVAADLLATLIEAVPGDALQRVLDEDGWLFAPMHTNLSQYDSIGTRLADYARLDSSEPWDEARLRVESRRFARMALFRLRPDQDQDLFQLQLASSDDFADARRLHSDVSSLFDQAISAHAHRTPTRGFRSIVHKALQHALGQIGWILSDTGAGCILSRTAPSSLGK